MNETARQAKEAACRGDSRTVYHRTKEIAGKSRIQEWPVKDKNVRLQIDAVEQKETVGELF